MKVWKFLVVAENENTGDIGSQIITIFGNDNRLTLSDSTVNCRYCVRDNGIFDDAESLNMSETLISFYETDECLEEDTFSENIDHIYESYGEYKTEARTVLDVYLIGTDKKGKDLFQVTYRNIDGTCGRENITYMKYKKGYYITNDTFYVADSVWIYKYDSLFKG